MVEEQETSQAISTDPCIQAYFQTFAYSARAAISDYLCKKENGREEVDVLVTISDGVLNGASDAFVADLHMIVSYDKQTALVEHFLLMPDGGDIGIALSEAIDDFLRKGGSAETEVNVTILVLGPDGDVGTSRSFRFDLKRFDFLKQVA